MSLSVLIFLAATAAAPEAAADAVNPVVVLSTSLGDIKIELDAKRAPISTKNFLSYVDSGHYDGTIFHRVIPDFMIQGGGMDADMREKATGKPIKNESGNGLKNERGTIAMARTMDPNSATAQFFINHKTNAFLDQGAGYAVFGRVISGMTVVDSIAGVKTTTKNGHQNVPLMPITIKKAKRAGAPAPEKKAADEAKKPAEDAKKAKPEADDAKAEKPAEPSAQ
jgi:peptidyl-prolyl cis-trans isomerase A (cyclophilin A)